MNIRIFLVDDDAAIQKAVQLLLRGEPGLELCGTAETATDALKQILSLEPALAIVDLSLGKESGLDLVHDLRSFCPKLKILIFSIHTEPARIWETFHAGADGYVTKEEGSESLLEAIRSIMRGHSYLSQATAASLGVSPDDIRRSPAGLQGRD